MITMVKIECSDCSGEGFEDIIGDCDLPASMCCGGCVKTYKCEECDGNGFIYVDEDEIDEY